MWRAGDDSAAESDASSLSDYDTSADPMERFAVTALPSTLPQTSAPEPADSSIAAAESSHHVAVYAPQQRSIGASGTESTSSSNMDNKLQIQESGQVCMIFSETGLKQDVV